jgi:hypothetical protein
VPRVGKTKGAATKAPKRVTTPRAKPSAKLARAPRPAKRASARPAPARATVRRASATHAEPAAQAEPTRAEPAAQILRAPAASVPAARADDDDDDDAPPGREEMLATRDIGRLLRYGERFGTDKIDVRMLPLHLHAGSGALAICDPGAPASWRVFDRPIANGAFRVMLSIARPDDGARERLAAVVIHVGRPPIARWTVAHFRGEPRPTSADALPRVATTSGWLLLLDAGGEAPGVVALPAASGVTPSEVPLGDGRRALALPCGDGAFAAYWAVDAADKPICIVLDFEAFTAKAWKAKPRAI